MTFPEYNKLPCADSMIFFWAAEIVLCNYQKLSCRKTWIVLSSINCAVKETWFVLNRIHFGVRCNTLSCTYYPVSVLYVILCPVQANNLLNSALQVFTNRCVFPGGIRDSEHGEPRRGVKVPGAVHGHSYSRPSHPWHHHSASYLLCHRQEEPLYVPVWRGAGPHYCPRHGVKVQCNMQE